MSEAELTKDEHVERVRGAAQGFLDAVAAAGDAGVSQAIILPMLLEMLQASGIGLPALGASLPSLQTG